MLKNYWGKLKVNLQTNRKIIMVDINMLEMDGYEVLNQLNKMDNFETLKCLQSREIFILMTYKKD